MIREQDLSVPFPERTFATVDHIIPTNTEERKRPLLDPLAEEMLQHIENNTVDYGINFFSPENGEQGVVHVVGPERGLTLPGMTIACGDSHTSTHGAFGAVAFGVGTSQVRDLLATQTLAMNKLKVRRISVEGELGPGVYAKDVILHIIRTLGVNGGTGYAYEYGGEVFDNFSMEERMTVCNMSIEGGARVGYVNPDQITYDYLKGRPYAPQYDRWEEAVPRWQSYASDPGCDYDDVVNLRAEEVPPTVTWGINPGQAVGIDETLPVPAEVDEDERAGVEEALEHMKLVAGAPVKGTKVDVAFIGSCTNSRISDLEEVAEQVKGFKVRDGVKAIVVPGSQIVSLIAEEKGLHEVFIKAGFEWRAAGCSMCLAMNPDKLVGAQLCASSSTRNFQGRQGSPTGRTMLMSPVMVAAAAVTGEVSDAREVFTT